MKPKVKTKNKSEKQNFIKDYNAIVRSSDTSVVVKSEWAKEGDCFKILTIYDNNYTFIPTLGETTLINEL